MQEQYFTTPGRGWADKKSALTRTYPGLRPLASMRNLVDDYRSEGLDANAAREKALAGICHTLLNTNEFLYVQ